MAKVATAQPAETPSVETTQPTEARPAAQPDDDLLLSLGLRPMAGARVEAAGAVGSEDTRAGVLRASDRFGHVGVEATGVWRDTGGELPLARRDAGARIERTTEASRVRVLGRWNTWEQRDGETMVLDSHDLVAGADATLWRDFGRIDVTAFGTRMRGELTTPASTRGARASLGSHRVHALGLDHELSLGAGALQMASREELDEDVLDMETHMTVLARSLRGEHRYLDAYIHDAIRVIETLDISGGFVIEQWRWLTGHQAIGDHDNDMGDAQPEISEALFGPRVGALYRVDDHLAMQARGYHMLRAPTPDQLYRSEQIGALQIGANEQLRPETVTGGELGPRVVAGPLEASSVVFWNEIDAPITAAVLEDGSLQRQNGDHARETGLETAASFHATKALHASASYAFTHTPVAFTAKNCATAALTYDDPRLATLTTALRYTDRTATGAYTVVDALAARKLTGGVAGFLSIDNLLDRRYVGGVPRTVAVGVRVDSARF